MAYRVAFSKSFKRAYRKKVRRNSVLVERFEKKLSQFLVDPYAPSLRTHKLAGDPPLWSFSVAYDLRVIFYFAEGERAVFIDIGTHDEVY